MLHFSELEPRPPYESDSLLLEVSTGCSQAVPCVFCGFYGKSFSIKPMEQIAAELDEVAEMWIAKPKRAFLLAGNAFGIPGDTLIEILELIQNKVPSIKSVGGFMRVDDIKHLDDSQLARLAELGARDLSIGGESGSDELLEFLGKYHRAHDIVEQCARLDAVGITYTLWYISGAAGAGKCVENARTSAKVFSQTHPVRVYISTLGVFPNSKLQEIVDAGDFVLPEPYEIVQDIREFYANLECDVLVDCMNEHNYIYFMSQLPEGRETLLENLDSILARDSLKRAKRPEPKIEIVGGKYVD